MKKIILTLIAVSSVIFSGCAGTVVQSNVVRFHQLPLLGAQRSFVIAPTEAQKGSIEFSTYANRISQKLAAYGWLRSDRDPDYVVFVSYGIGDGQTVSGSMPIYGQTGGGTSYTSGTVRSSYGGHGTYSGTTYTQPTFGQTGSIPYTQTQYSRTLLITILDDKASQKGNPVKVFEGRVTSRGSNSDVATVMPNMIEALFNKFPGTSGKSEMIEMSLME